MLITPNSFLFPVSFENPAMIISIGGDYPVGSTLEYEQVTVQVSSQESVILGIPATQGPAGPTGSAGSSSNLALDYTSNASLAGVIDGANRIFTLSRLPQVGSAIWVYINGLLQDPTDFSIIGSIITLSSAPLPALAGIPGDRVSATYAY